VRPVLDIFERLLAIGAGVDVIASPFQVTTMRMILKGPPGVILRRRVLDFLAALAEARRTAPEPALVDEALAIAEEGNYEERETWR